MSEDHLAVQDPALQSAVADLQAAAAKLRGAKETMDTGVRNNTDLWLSSNSPAAAAWKAADVEIGRLIDKLHLYAVTFSRTTEESRVAFNNTENKITTSFG